MFRNNKNLDRLSLSKSYKEYEDNLYLKRFNIVLSISFIFVILFGILDFILYQERASLMWSVRLVASLVIFILLLIYKKIKKHIRKLSFLAITGFYICINILIFLTQEGASSPYYSGLILAMVALSTIIPWNGKQTSAICLENIILYLLTILLFTLYSGKDANLKILTNNLFFMISTASFCIASKYLDNKLRFKEFCTNYKLENTINNIKKLENKVVSDSQKPLLETSKISLLMLKLLKDEKIEQQIDKIIIPKANYSETILFLEIMSSSLDKGKNITDIILNNINNHSIDKSKLDFKNFNSNDILNHVIKNYKFIYDNQLLINYNPDHDFNLSADYNLLVFVILNIIQNALKYKSQIDIGFSEEDNFNIIYIKNKNSYIDNEKKGNLFKESYSDIEKTISLGLSFCKKSMISFGGDIKVNSNKKGNWTKFSLYFPTFE